MASGKRVRVDQALVARGLCQSREQAKRLVLAGQVRINLQRAHKSSDGVRPSDRLEVIALPRFVSRGGEKLEGALRQFGLTVSGCRAIDLGSSTGGFVDCLLQSGAERVYAVDVGSGQLAWRLRRDPRVGVIERTNARYLTADQLPQPFSPVDLVTIDCSFISLRLLLPRAIALLKPSGKIVALIKPQFEAGKVEADRGHGVIRDARVHAAVLDKLKSFVSRRTDCRWIDLAPSPLLGPAGNKEFFVLIEKIC